MDRGESDSPKPDSSAVHLALQETLRGPDTFAAARSASDGSTPILKKLLLPIAARLVHFFARYQVDWNFSVARTLEAAVRGLDERDRWIERLIERLRSAEQRVGQLETEIRGAREAEEDARRKLAALGIRLRELEERQRALGSRVESGNG